MSTRAGGLFETRVRAFLAEHPGIAHEWRPVKSVMAGNRLDIIFGKASPDIWATIREDQIAVGSGAEHEDFEANGNTAEKTAENAFAHLQQLLRNARLVEAQQGVPADVARPAGERRG